MEAAWYAWWEKSGFFKPEYGRKSVKDIPEVGKVYSGLFTVHLNRIFGSPDFLQVFSGFKSNRPSPLSTIIFEVDEMDQRPNPSRETVPLSSKNRIRNVHFP